MGKSFFQLVQFFPFVPSPNPPAWLHNIFFYNFDTFSIFSNCNSCLFNLGPNLFTFNLTSKFVFMFFLVLIWKKYKNLV